MILANDSGMLMDRMLGEEGKVIMKKTAKGNPTLAVTGEGPKSNPFHTGVLDQSVS